MRKELRGKAEISPFVLTRGVGFRRDVLQTPRKGDLAEEPPQSQVYYPPGIAAPRFLGIN